MPRSILTRLARPLLVLGLLLLSAAAPRAALAKDVPDDILSQVAQVRGLPPKAKVPFAFVEPQQLRQDLLQSFNDEATVRELETSRKLLVALGLLSPDADLHGMLVDLYSENVLGYYNHADKTMYVVSGQTTFGPSEKATLAHEYTHALQDQYFDLSTLERSAQQNGDRSLAIQALVEGDATLSMILYARSYFSPEEILQLQLSSSESTLDRAPLVVRDEVVFPYNEGVIFALQLWQQGGFDALNAAFRRPPQSTEQIMHPDKYLAGEAPLEVTLPDLAATLGNGWKQLRSDVLGELDLRILLEQFSDPVTASQGAAGWGGDRFAVLESPSGQLAVVISTVWDNENEAGEFFNDYAATVARRYGRRAERIEDVPSKLRWQTPNGGLLLEKWGPRVAIIIAPDQGTVDTLLQAIAPGAPAQIPAPVQVPR